jgi:hypothetical protein
VFALKPARIGNSAKIPAMLALLGFNAMGDAIRDRLDRPAEDEPDLGGWTAESISHCCYNHG